MIDKIGLERYCDNYNIPEKHLLDIINDLKVIPMIRGKGFEFFVSDKLKKILNKHVWEVSNPLMNAQPGTRDIDVKVINTKTNEITRIECKLAKNNSIKSDLNIKFQVKCMRSRAIGHKEVATRVAKEYGINTQDVLEHADQYREDDFDLIATSLDNAFWSSDSNGRYIFNYKKPYAEKLSQMFPKLFKEPYNPQEFKKSSANFILIARSKDIKVSKENKIICRRRDCRNKENCGFIPNYPIINLNEVAEGSSPWINILEIEKLLN